VFHDRFVVFRGYEGAGLTSDVMHIIIKLLGEFREDFSGGFLEVRNGDSCSKYGIIGMLGCERGGGLCSKSGYFMGGRRRIKRECER